MIQAIQLRTEYLENPMGIDILSPRVFWRVTGARKQTGCRIEYIRNGETVIREAATDAMWAVCPLELHSRDAVRWRVQLADEHGETGPWSDWASFEMGLLQKSDWQAKWIMGNYIHDPKPAVRYPVDCFRKTFSIPQKAVSARLYATACGMFEATVNGKRVGDRVLAPGSTAFQKRVHYHTYDVTELLAESNVLELALADGFYASKTGCFNKPKVFGREPKVLAQLEWVDENGERHTIGTDGSFRWSNDGPIRYADLKDGEDLDANALPTYGGNALETEYSGIVCADNNVPVREKESFSPARVLHTPNGQTVLDFGQNIAGYVAFSICGPKGHVAEMVLGEKLTDAGNFTTANISLKGDYTDERLQRVRFTCSGGNDTCKPRFCVMGFQYALLLNWPEEVKPENFTAIAVYSDMEVTGHFDSSNAELNQIVQNTLWSMKGNFLDVPTDCPTRERAGWTGDAQLFFRTGNYLMDQRAFFRKWLRDVEDCQKGNGMVYNINPANPSSPAIVEWFSVEGGVGWGDAFLMIPYYFWKRYGDDSLIRRHWPAMKKCFQFYCRRVGKRNLFSLFTPGYGKYSKYLCACGRDFGEWTEPEDCKPAMWKLMLPHGEESTAYISYDAALMAEMSEHMGEDGEALRQLSESVRQAYRHYYINEKTLRTNRMCKLVRPCALNLAEGRERDTLLRQIAQLNRQRDHKIGTGFLTTPFVLYTLTEAGAIEDAWKLLMNPELGWVQQIRQGATTVWENWEDDASLNHYSKGACCQWLFDCLCGIRLDGRENHFVIEPHTVNALDHIRFAYDSAYGTVESGWEKTENGHRFAVTIPANCTAQVKLPGREAMHLPSGSYRFEEEKA